VSPEVSPVFDEFAVGMEFPRPEDKDRLLRYEAARVLYEGRHYESKNAKRIVQKLNESRDPLWSGNTMNEGVVYITFNLPRLVVDKFADLQVLQTPIINLVDNVQEEELLERINEDVPDLWGTVHEAKSRALAFGDAGLSVLREEDGTLGVRLVDGSRWYPVLSPSDPLTVTAHQIAWVEDIEVGNEAKPFLRVDVCRPDMIERRAYALESSHRYNASGDAIQTFRIKAQIALDTYWPGLREMDTEDLGGLCSFVHLANGHLDPAEIFGRPEFIDSGALIDDINWRLSSWSDANDKVSHAPRIIPKSYVHVDEYGGVAAPSQFQRTFVGSGREDAETPKYMSYELDHATLKEQFEASVLAFLMRHEMSPALLGLNFGREVESGEAKSLGMGTTEAKTRRDLLRTQPQIDRALTALARLAGFARKERVSTHWRVGLPKSQAELVAELRELRTLGVLTRRQVLERIYPWFDAEQIDELLAELDAERQAELEAMAPAFTSREG
jgi:hypothetical protein